jgi:hypothetical protein
MQVTGEIATMSAVCGVTPGATLTVARYSLPVKLSLTTSRLSFSRTSFVPAVNFPFTEISAVPPGKRQPLETKWISGVG